MERWWPMQPEQALSRDWLRPSMLPKLAKCSQYRPDETPTEATLRGQRLDAVFRARIAKRNSDMSDLTDADRVAVRWAVETAFALAGRYTLESEEAELRVALSLGLTGTADLLCREGRWSADLKSGQKHNYVEQQAAYALGFMEAFFEEEWTVYLLYCDLEQVETLRFCKAQAEEIVRGTLAKAHDDFPPAINEYCGWCARRWDCAARREAVGIAPIGEPGALKLADAPSAMLREFSLRAAVVADFDEQAREILRERMLKGERVPGCSLVSKRGTRKAPHTLVELHLREMGAGDVLAAYGALSETKFREIWDRKLPGKPFPAAEIQEMPGATFVRVGRPRGE